VVFEATIPVGKRLLGIAVGDGPILEIAPPATAATPVAAPIPEPEPPRGPSGEDIAFMERLLANFEELTNDLRAQQRQRLVEMQRVAIEVAVAVASRLVHQRLEAGDFSVDGLVRQVAERLEAKDALTIHLHPADLSLLEKQAGDCRRLLPGDGNLKLIADASLNRGDCRAETGDMSLVLKVDQQLDEMRKHLLDILPDAEIEQRRAQAGDRQLRRFPDRRHIA
jgi:hypothetical protein